MAPSPVQPKRIVVRANRDTLILVAAATAATCGLAYSIHTRPPEDVAASQPAVQQQEWTGELADAASAPTQTTVAEPLTTASLTVPRSTLTLPAPGRVKPKLTCEGSACPVKVPPRPQTAHVEALPHAPHRDRSLIARLNPLNHLDTLQKPFVYAGDTISGWFRRF